MMPRIWIPLCTAFLLGAVGPMTWAEKESQRGSVSTKSGEAFEGELLFSKDKLIVHPGGASEAVIAFDQIEKVRIHRGNRAEPRPERVEFRNGLFAEYFGSKNLERNRETRIDRTINFRWGHGAPVGPGYVQSGLMNHAGIPVLITLILAQECGVKVDEGAYTRAVALMYRMAGHGCIKATARV